MHWQFLLPALLFQLTFYALLRPLFPAPRQRAWILTLAVSALFGLLVGPLYLLTFFTALAHPSPAAALGRALEAEGWPDAAAASFMITFLALDITIGRLDYAEHLRLDTGYIHHAVYLPIYSYMLYFGFTPFLLLGACCEVPTFIMALGTLFPGLRQDLAFGVTFFFTRIVWFIVLLAVYLHPVANTRVRGRAARGPAPPMHDALSFLLPRMSLAPSHTLPRPQLSIYLYLPPTLAALMLHLWWFSKWLKCGVSGSGSGKPPRSEAARSE
jgi:hypothetical protein